MKIAGFFAAVTIGISGLCVNAASAADIKVFSSNGMKDVLQELATDFTSATGHKLVTTFNSATAIKRQIQNGASFDIAFVTPTMMADLVKEGKIAPGALDIARIGIGVAIRAGAPKPDIATPDSFKQTLLAAKSVMYNKEGQSGIHMARVIERLGIADAMKAKTVLKLEGGPVAEHVARGEVEFGFQLISEIVSVRGVELLGPLPGALQNFVVLSAGIGADAKEPEAARVLINYLVTPQGIAVMKAKGVEPAAK